MGTPAQGASTDVVDQCAVQAQQRVGDDVGNHVIGVCTSLLGQHRSERPRAVPEDLALARQQGGTLGDDARDRLDLPPPTRRAPSFSNTP